MLGYMSCVTYVSYWLCINVTNMYVVSKYVICTYGHFITHALN